MPARTERAVQRVQTVRKRRNDQRTYRRNQQQARCDHLREGRRLFFFFSSRRRHTRFDCDWSSDVCSSDLAVGFGAWWVARRAVAPVQAIAAQAETISASDLHQRLPAPSSQDEIAHLTSVLNGMFDRLQRSFDQVTRFTSDASHELRTPLALMRAEAESALNDRNATSDQHQHCASIIKQCLELSQIIDGLLFLSRADNRRLALEQETVDLTSLVRELREDAEILALPLNLTLQCDLPSDRKSTR